MATNGGDGSRFMALAIAAAVVAILVLLPFMIVAGFYSLANVQALITGSDLSAQALNIPVFLILLVGMVALFILVLFGVVSFIGRSFSPRRREGQAEPLAEVPEA